MVGISYSKPLRERLAAWNSQALVRLGVSGEREEVICTRPAQGSPALVGRERKFRCDSGLFVRIWFDRHHRSL
jgi:hypothetical protein